MSYASVAAHNAPPVSEQPQPDPSLLNTAPSTHPDVADETSKVNIVSADFKEHPATVTSEFAHNSSALFTSGHSDPDESRVKKNVAAVDSEATSLWEKLKNTVLRPSVVGGLVGVVNIGLLASGAYALYTEPRFRRDPTLIASTVVGALTIIGTEDYVAEAYLKTAAGQNEARKAKEKGSLVYRYAREHVLRPDLCGGLVGLVNVGVLGTVSYFAYANWDRPRWDRRTISAVSIGLLSLWGSEGYAVSREDVKRQLRR